MSLRVRISCGLALSALLCVLSGQTVGPIRTRRTPPGKAPRVVSPPPAAPEAQAATPEAALHDDPLIAKAIDANLNFAEALPNFICMQVTRRSSSRDLGRRWKLVDTVAAEVIYEDGRESYQNIRVDGRAVASLDSLDGSTSTGEYGTMLRNLFLDYTATEFRFVEPSMIRGAQTSLYEFRVDEATSHWRITVNGRSISPAYRGRVWLETETGRVYRIEMEALDIPPNFPMHSSETMVEYGWVEIAGKRHLLPLESANLFCSRSSTLCRKNELEFTDYRKFSASSSVFQTDSEVDFGEQDSVREEPPEQAP